MDETLVKVPVTIGTVPLREQVKDLEEGTKPFLPTYNLCKKTIMHNGSCRE
jgi:hypothetical protein